jgi:arylsulfatase A-like enzyme
MADTLLAQFGEEISHHEFYKTQYLEYQSGNSIQWFDKLLRNEPDTAQLFKSLLSDSGIEGYLYALLFPSLLGDSSFEIPPELLAQFPNGVPTAHGTDPFILEDAIQWTADQVSTLPQPFLGYFHYLPPHGAFRTRIDFVDTFLDDGYAHVRKPIHPAVLANKTPINYETEQNVIRLYDEYILYVDSEFNRLFNILDQQGALENTLLVFTSDHGEVIERGTNGHMLPYLYEPVIKVPLVIFEPGQTERRDVYSRTSAVDILPTVLHYTGHTVPTELPGQVLPTFSDSPIDTSRTLYTLYARENPNAANLAVATLAMIRENMKVIQYHGYSTSRHNLNLGKQYGVTLSDIDPYYEVYDLENDPEEMNNLALNPTSEIRELIEEIEQLYVDNIEYPNIREEDR